MDHMVTVLAVDGGLVCSVAGAMPGLISQASRFDSGRCNLAR